MRCPKFYRCDRHTNSNQFTFIRRVTARNNHCREKYLSLNSSCNPLKIILQLFFATAQEDSSEEACSRLPVCGHDTTERNKEGGLERPRLLPYSLCVPIMACLLIPGTDYSRCARWLEYWSFSFQTTFVILPAQSLLLVVSRYPLGQVHTKLPSVLLHLYWHKDCGHSSMSIIWTNIWILNDVLLFVGETWFTDSRNLAWIDKKLNREANKPTNDIIAIRLTAIKFSSAQLLDPLHLWHKSDMV